MRSDFLRTLCCGRSGRDSYAGLGGAQQFFQSLNGILRAEDGRSRDQDLGAGLFDHSDLFARLTEISR
jgi:hypothetical protein